MLSILIILFAAYGSAALVGLVVLLSRTRFNTKEIRHLIIRKSFLRLLQSIIFVFIFLVIIFIALSKYFPEFGNADWIKKDNGTPLLVLLTGILATIGWVFSIHAQERNLAKEHAYRMIENSMHDPVLAEHKRNIFMRYPPNKNVPPEDVDELMKAQSDVFEYKNGKYAIFYSIVQVLNVYETMAIGIRSDKIDEYIVKDYIGSIIKNACTKKFRTIIAYVRRPNENFERPTSYRDLVWLVKRWFDIDLDDLPN